jgi:hypothetical protein
MKIAVSISFLQNPRKSRRKPKKAVYFHRSSHGKTTEAS